MYIIAGLMLVSAVIPLIVRPPAPETGESGNYA
jgi:hypothetical protein